MATSSNSHANSNAAAGQLAAELKQMSSYHNPAYGSLANFDIERRVRAFQLKYIESGFINL